MAQAGSKSTKWLMVRPGHWLQLTGGRWRHAPGPPPEAEAAPAGGERKAKGKPKLPRKPKPDRAKAIKAVAAAVARGKIKRDACKDVYGTYGYPTWTALEKAYDRSKKPSGQ